MGHRATAMVSIDATITKVAKIAPSAGRPATRVNIRTVPIMMTK